MLLAPAGYQPDFDGLLVQTGGSNSYGRAMLRKMVLDALDVVAVRREALREESSAALSAEVVKHAEARCGDDPHAQLRLLRDRRAAFDALLKAARKLAPFAWRLTAARDEAAAARRAATAAGATPAAEAHHAAAADAVRALEAQAKAASAGHDGPAAQAALDELLQGRLPSARLLDGRSVKRDALALAQALLDRANMAKLDASCRAMQACEAAIARRRGSCAAAGGGRGDAAGGWPAGPAAQSNAAATESEGSPAKLQQYAAVMCVARLGELTAIVREAEAAVAAARREVELERAAIDALETRLRGELRNHRLSVDGERNDGPPAGAGDVVGAPEVAGGGQAQQELEEEEDDDADD